MGQQPPSIISCCWHSCYTCLASSEEEDPLVRFDLNGRQDNNVFKPVLNAHAGELSDDDDVTVYNPHPLSPSARRLTKDPMVRTVRGVNKTCAAEPSSLSDSEGAKSCSDASGPRLAKPECSEQFVQTGTPFSGPAARLVLTRDMLVSFRKALKEAVDVSPFNSAKFSHPLWTWDFITTVFSCRHD